MAAAIDIASECTDRMGQLILVDQAIRFGLIGVRDIDGFRRTRVRDRRWLAGMADGRAESLIETIARALLVGAGFTVECQVRIDGVLPPVFWSVSSVSPVQW
ncbi:hypothetical protein [Demequina maris]|uniref:hypothetical protein n=1 Tax=Demequina maris TaxID=1638982 RepID=UPI000780222F|nr:hypothetical protein [Demequina maris]